MKSNTIFITHSIVWNMLHTLWRLGIRKGEYRMMPESGKFINKWERKLYES